MIAQSRAKSPPLSVGRFELLGRAGTGISDVHRGRDGDGQPVAVYLFPGDRARLGARLSAAYETAAAIDHPNVLRVIDFGREGEFVYLVTEWVEGTTLARMIEMHGRLPEANVIRFLAQVGQAMDHLRKGDVAPCEVNPRQVLLRTDGVAKVIPFPRPDEPGTPALGVPGLSTAALLKPPSAAVPTAVKAAPAPDAAKPIPFADVIFSLGMILHEALTGSVWIPPRGHESTGRRRSRPAPPRPAGLTDRAERAIRRATDLDPARRPATCADFVKLLRTRSPSTGTKKADARGADAAANNRRGCVRYALGVGSNCTINASVFDPPDAPSGTNEVWPLVVQDVSATGIGLLLARRCEPGTELSVEVVIDAGRAPRCLPVRVVRVRKDNFGHWMHGCTFLTPLDETALTALLDHLGRADTA